MIKPLDYFEGRKPDLVSMIDDREAVYALMDRSPHSFSEMVALIEARVTTLWLIAYGSGGVQLHYHGMAAKLVFMVSGFGGELPMPLTELYGWLRNTEITKEFILEKGIELITLKIGEGNKKWESVMSNFQTVPNEVRYVLNCKIGVQVCEIIPNEETTI